MPPPPSFPVDWEGLAVAFESRSNQITHFFDRQTGDVVQVLERDAARHAAMSADPRYSAVPRDQGERSRGDLEEFAARCEDAACRRDLVAALGENDFAAAYRKALLGHPKEEARFFQFKERRARERAAEWLTASGISFEPEAPRPERPSR
ncbi:MAG TPA: UPF0158 family protein [Thermoanaerobaculia bacterium]|nr:UPF0158 family protein [Thermoanaerobaculia bacterium]